MPSVQIVAPAHTRDGRDAVTALVSTTSLTSPTVAAPDEDDHRAAIHSRPQRGAAGIAKRFSSVAQDTR